MTNGPIKRSPSKKLLEAASKKNTNALTVMKQKRKAARIAEVEARSKHYMAKLTAGRGSHRADYHKLTAAAKALRKSARSPK